MKDNGPSGQCAKVQNHNTHKLLFLWLPQFQTQIFPVPEVVCTNRRPYNVKWWDVWWNEVLKLGRKVQYECVRGYKKGSYLAQCTRNDWEPKPLCQGIVNVLSFSISVRKYSVFLISRSAITSKCKELL